MAFNLTEDGLKCGSDLAIKFVPGNATSSDQLTLYWGTNKIQWDEINTSNATVTSSTRENINFSKGTVGSGSSAYLQFTVDNFPTYQVPSMSVGEKRIVRIGASIDATIRSRDQFKILRAIRLPSTGDYLCQYRLGQPDSYKKEDQVDTQSSLTFSPFPGRKDLGAGGTQYECSQYPSNPISALTMIYFTFFIQRYS